MRSFLLLLSLLEVTRVLSRRPTLPPHHFQHPSSGGQLHAHSFSQISPNSSSSSFKPLLFPNLLFLFLSISQLFLPYLLSLVFSHLGILFFSSKFSSFFCLGTLLPWLGAGEWYPWCRTMRAGKGNQEEEEYEEEDFGSSKKQGASSLPNTNNTNKDAKAIDKASVIRSKHSVTEQRRRSKINERFQILRDLIPHSDQKRDTASFLLEVIEYVQFLQEKVQRYEGSYQGWSHEPSKLMPWRNSHWRVQSFVGQPQVVKNGSGPVSPFPGKLDESNISISPSMLSGTQNTIDPDPSRDIVSKSAEGQPDLASKGIPLPLAMHANMSVPVRSDGVLAHPLQGTVSEAQSTECPATSEPRNQQDELTIEGGTISISSVYSQGLLNNLTQALESAGLDLSQASISVQINLGKRANKGPTCGTSSPKNHDNLPSSNQAIAHFRDAVSEDSDQAQKRLKTFK